MDIYLSKYEFAKSLRDIVVDYGERTGGSPTIFHRPYADARLPSLIEAACFYSLGLDVGTRFAEPGLNNVDNAYRAVNLQAAPPVDPSRLLLALQLGMKAPHGHL
ncbi:hypothetical protein ACPWT1_03015 [Ramlibacter sp. MMS24-I3-19]|uniref:hypothetical protein n=1 Tax=Ramlibacter sp. MMS24-I3-19 TaxID=3416606 RepID=UPI003D057A0E